MSRPPSHPASVPPAIACHEQCFQFPTWTSFPLVQLTSARQLSFDQTLARYQLTQADVVWAEQVHGAESALVASRDRGHERAGCDALVTRDRGVPLAIRTADCTPLFLYDPQQQVIGLAHVGWRGLAADLPTRVIRYFAQHVQSDPQQLVAGLGPAIRKCCYEVGPEVRAQLPEDCEDHAGRTVLDIPSGILRRLARAGLLSAHVHDGALCTACHVEQCYSVRREGAQTGRLLSLLMLRAS